MELKTDLINPIVKEPYNFDFFFEQNEIIINQWKVLLIHYWNRTKKNKFTPVIKKKKTSLVTKFSFFFFYSFLNHLIRLFGFRGNSGFGFKFFSKLLQYIKYYYNYDGLFLFYFFLSELRLPFALRELKQSGRGIPVPLLINVPSQYKFLFRLCLKVRKKSFFPLFFQIIDPLRNSFFFEDSFYFDYESRMHVAAKNLVYFRYKW